MQMTDLHFGEKERYDTATQKEMEDLMDWEKPDMVVLTGDMVSGYAWDKTEGW